MNDLSVTHRHVPVTVPTTEQTEKECVTGKDAGILPEDPLANTEGGGLTLRGRKGVWVIQEKCKL